MARYKLEQKTFEIIDTPEKAYWIGFIWCDGTVIKRERGNGLTYEFKMDLQRSDEYILYCLKDLLKAEQPIRQYEPSKTGFANGQGFSRLHIANKEFGRILYENYGIVADRTNATKLLKAIPKEFISHFIRGVLDGDGSFVISNVECHKYSETKKSFFSKKALLRFSTNIEIANFINTHLLEIGLLNQELKLSKRHEERDGDCVQLSISGTRQCENILDYLYQGATIYLERKYKKYQELKTLNKNN